MRRAGLLAGGRKQADQSSVAGRRDFRAMSLPVSLLMLFFAYWCVDIVSPVLPTIQESLELSATGAGLVISVFFAGRLVSNLPAAWLVQRAGPKWTAALGAGALLAGSVLAATSASQSALLPARGIQGAGVAILATAGLLSVLRVRSGRGAAMTAFNVSTGIGGSIGLLSGGFLTGEFGWRAVFWLSALVSVALIAATVAARDSPGFDGQVRASVGRDEEASIPVAGAVLVAVASNLLVFVNYAIWIVSIPLLVAHKFGFGAGQVGLTLLFVNIVHLLAAVPIGRLIGKFGASRTLATGFAVVGAGMMLVPMAPSVPWLIAPLALYAIGQVAGNSAAGDLILRLGGEGGRAVGAVRLSSDVGLVVGPAAAGGLADASGVDAPFLTLGVVAIAGTVVCLAVNQRWPLNWNRAPARRLDSTG